jgi:hypothetical protein
MTLATRQLKTLRRMAALDPPPCFIGGFAEDASRTPENELEPQVEPLA